MLDYKRVENDIVLNGDIQIVDDYIDNVIQKIIFNLKRFRGEDFLNVTRGVDYFGLVFVQSPDLLIIEAILKKAIYEVNEVDEITNFSAEFDNSKRHLSITFSARLKKENAEIINETIEVL